MAITKDSGRQTVLAAFVNFTYADYTSGTAVEAVDLPPDAVILGGELVIETAWNSATSSTCLIGDGADPDRYETDADMKATAGTRYPLTLTGYQYPASDTLDLTITDVGTPTAGAARLIVYYIREGRANENQG